MTLGPPSEIRRIIYMGSPASAVAPLRALHEAGYEIPLVVSRADTRRGRGGGHQPTAVKAAAMELGLDMTDQLGDVAEVKADLGVVVAYGQLLPSSVLDVLPMVNIHFSLLPRWRGAAPVERAILAGDRESGLCLMELVEQLDAGPIYRQVSTAIGADETAADLVSRLSDLGADTLVAALGEGLGEPAPQVGEPVYAHKVSSDELRIDWTDDADRIHRVLRVGGAWTTFRGQRMKIHAGRPSARVDGMPGSIFGSLVVAGEGAIELDIVQLEGKGRVEATAWANGARLQLGERLDE